MSVPYLVRVALGANLLFTSACIGDLKTEVSQRYDGTFAISTSFVATGACTVRLGENEVRESLPRKGRHHRVTWCFADRSFPYLGTQSVTVKVKCGLSSSNSTVSFQRQPRKARSWWAHEHVYCDGEICREIDIVGNTKMRPDGTLVIEFQIPGGGRLTIDGQTVTSATTPRLSDGLRDWGCEAPLLTLNVDMKKHVLDVPLAGTVGNNPSAKASLAAQAASDRPGELRVHRQGITVPVTAMLAKVTAGPVLFDNEKPESRLPRSALVVRRDGGEEKIESFFGEAETTLRTVDLVAFATTVPPRRKFGRCGPYLAQGQPKPFYWEVWSDGDEEVAVYERRTGRLVTKRVFRASADYECPASYSTFAAGGHPDPENGGAARKHARRWLRDLVKARSCVIQEGWLPQNRLVGCDGKELEKSHLP
jgi:hypothetical protein